MNRIVIIGTQPPCPRCGLLSRVVSEKIRELKINAEIVHLSYDDLESQDYAGQFGLKAGTAKDVAKIIKRDINTDKLNEIINNWKPDKNCEFKNFNDFKWSLALDDYLRPFETKAKDAGILMTPVLIINGKMKHNGSVPGLDKIVDWLSELK